MKTKLLGLSLMVLSGLLDAQNASYKLNTTPISGANNTAFGFSINNTNTGTMNTGVGFSSLSALTTGNFNVGSGAQSLNGITSGNYNSAAGFQALFSNQTGFCNTAQGSNSLFSNTGSLNSAIGDSSLYFNTSGTNNTAIGKSSLLSNTANNNTATGAFSQYRNTTGAGNVSNGFLSMYSNTTGSVNVAIGDSAFYSNTTGNWCIAIGPQALRNDNTTGNIAIGAFAMRSHTGGAGKNIAIGINAMTGATGGSENIAIGWNTLVQTTASDNTAVGFQSANNLSTGGFNAAFGASALLVTTTGTANVALGNNTLIQNITGNNNTGVGLVANLSTTNLSNATALGSRAVANASNKVRFGDVNVTVVEGPVAYTFSDGRFKSNISESDVKGLEFIKLLRPVVYNLETQKIEEFLVQKMPDSIKKLYMSADFTASRAIRQTGFIAQEVEKAAEQVGYDFNGVHKPDNEIDNYSIAYGQFVVPLVKAVQEQQQMIEKLQQRVDSLETAKNSVGINTGINQLNTLSPSGFSLDQNIPNPFSQETVINYTLPDQASNPSILIYDLTGKQITSFALTQKGSSSITISSENLAAGIYIYSLTANGKILDTKRMVVAQK